MRRGTSMVEMLALCACTALLTGIAATLTAGLARHSQDFSHDPGTRVDRLFDELRWAGRSHWHIDKQGQLQMGGSQWENGPHGIERDGEALCTGTQLSWHTEDGVLWLEVSAAGREPVRIALPPVGDAP